MTADQALALGILAIFFSCVLAMLYDIECAIHEALLDELWGEDE